MARKPAQKFSVHRVQDGAQTQCEISLATARSEVSRLNAEARVRVGADYAGNPIYASMYLGEISRYEVRSAEGLVIA